MTSGSFVVPPLLCARMAGTVSRFIGAGVGFARLVAVSSWKVVDMDMGLDAASNGGNPAVCALYW